MTYHDNPVFGGGRSGIIQMRSGGELELKDVDLVAVSDNGLLINHADEFDTYTLVPWENVAWIRTRLRNRPSTRQAISQHKGELPASTE